MKGIETLKKVIAQHRYKDAELLLAARMEKLAGAKGRNKRLGRRAYPGRRGQLGWLCRRVPAQCDGQRGDSADQHDHGAIRRRCGVFPCHDRLHLHGERLLVHVCHRPRGGEDRDARRSDR